MDKQTAENNLREELGARKFQLKTAVERKIAAEKRIEKLNQRIAEIEVVLKPQSNPNQTTLNLKDNILTDAKIQSDLSKDGLYPDKK